MTARRLVVVADSTAAPPPEPGATVIVLDPAWVPQPGDRADLIPARRLMGPVIERTDLFDDALAIVDAWAEASGIADTLLVEGTTYWFRLRETMWRWMHERLLWRRSIANLDVDGALAVIDVLAVEPALSDVVRALGHPLTSDAPPTASAPADDRVPASRIRDGSRPSTAGRVRRLLGRALGRSGPAVPPAAAVDTRRLREGTLRARAERLASSELPRVVVLTNPGTHQRIGGADDGPLDPLFGGVIPGLEARDIQPVLLATGLDQRRDQDWSIVADDERMLPQFLLRTRWSGSADDERATSALAVVEAAIDAAAEVDVELDGLPLTTAFIDGLRSAARGIVRTDVQMLARIERFLGELGPSAVVLAQEGIRTPWLVAADKAGIPVVAVQHGILYPGHAGYPDRRHPALRLPTRTCVYGPFERDVLLGLAYRSEEIAVTGSPRLDLDPRDPDVGRDATRREVRRELRVADGDRLLVVTTINLRFIQRSHLVHMLETVFAPPPTDVHIVFKQHPGEHDDGPYRELVEGIARARGAAPPSISVVKDVDLYRLLRAADAHLGLFSTVLTEAVVTGTPDLIATTDAHADLLGYVAAGVARPVRSAADLEAALATTVLPDSERRQAFLDLHFRSGDATSRILDVVSAVMTPKGAIHAPADVGGQLR